MENTIAETKTVDISTLSAKHSISSDSLKGEPYHRVFGDMHANPCLFLWRLCDEGFITVNTETEAAYTILKNICDDYPATIERARNDPNTGLLNIVRAKFLENFKKQLAVFHEYCMVPSPHILTLLGDLVGDRNKTPDLCMYLILEILEQKGVLFNVIYSDHDQQAIANAWSERNKREIKLAQQIDADLTVLFHECLANACRTKDTYNCIYREKKKEDAIRCITALNALSREAQRIPDFLACIKKIPSWYSSDPLFLFLQSMALEQELSQASCSLGKERHSFLVMRQRRLEGRTQDFCTIKFQMQMSNIEHWMYVDNDLVSVDESDRLERLLLKHMELIGCTVTPVTGGQPIVRLFTHAPNALENFKALSTHYHVQWAEDTPDAIFKTMSSINTAFRKDLLGDWEAFKRIFNPGLPQGKQNSVFRFVWNREPVTNMIEREGLDSYQRELFYGHDYKVAGIVGAYNCDGIVGKGGKPEANKGELLSLKLPYTSRTWCSPLLQTSAIFFSPQPQRPGGLLTFRAGGESVLRTEQGTQSKPSSTGSDPEHESGITRRFSSFSL
jgi:hypothetical protein